MECKIENTCNWFEFVCALMCLEMIFCAGCKLFTSTSLTLLLAYCLQAQIHTNLQICFYTHTCIQILSIYIRTHIHIYFFQAHVFANNYLQHINSALLARAVAYAYVCRRIRYTYTHPHTYTHGKFCIAQEHTLALKYVRTYIHLSPSASAAPHTHTHTHAHTRTRGSTHGHSYTCKQHVYLQFTSYFALHTHTYTEFVALTLICFAYC